MSSHMIATGLTTCGSTVSSIRSESGSTTWPRLADGSWVTTNKLFSSCLCWSRVFAYPNRQFGDRGPFVLWKPLLSVEAHCHSDLCVDRGVEFGPRDNQALKLREGQHVRPALSSGPSGSAAASPGSRWRCWSPAPRRARACSGAAARSGSPPNSTSLRIRRDKWSYRSIPGTVTARAQARVDF